MLATPADQVRAEVRRVFAPAPAPPLLQPFEDDPPAALAALAELVRAYWERALAPHWPRIRALLEGDVLHRARQLADGGAQRLFAGIHPELRFADDTLFIDMPFDGHVDLEGRGLLFVPSAFTWPRPAASIEAPWQPFVVYSARGVASLWDPGRTPPPAALAALLGRRRASVLGALHSPRSTTELARALELSPGSVSQHLSVLRDAGVVNAHRVGRVVLYARAPTGDARRCKSPEDAHRPRPRRAAPAADALRRRLPGGDPRARDRRGPGAPRRPPRAVDRVARVARPPRAGARTGPRAARVRLARPVARAGARRDGGRRLRLAARRARLDATGRELRRRRGRLRDRAPRRRAVGAAGLDRHAHRRPRRGDRDRRGRRGADGAASSRRPPTPARVSRAIATSAARARSPTRTRAATTSR